MRLGKQTFYQTRVWASLAGAMLLLANTAYAALIEYEVEQVIDDTYEYRYWVTNDSLAGGLDEFSIFFAYDAFRDLQLVTLPTGWDPLVIQPEVSLTEDGYFDALGSASLALGETLAGFVVRATYFGSGSPASQGFDVIDPFTFAALESGRTVPRNSPPVPDTPAALLLVTGLLALWRQRRNSATQVRARNDGDRDP